MAKSNRGGRNKNIQQPQATTTQSTGTRSYRTMTDADAQQIRNDVDDRYTSDVRDAIKEYISKATDSQGYSMSQNLNYKLDNGIKLNATEKFMDKYMQQGMHDLGMNTTLTRACHDDVLKDLGIKDYSKMTEAQLNKALVGGVYTTKAYNSFSYDTSKNPFLTGPQSGGREVIIQASAPSTTKVVFGAKSQAEIITNKNTQYRIKKVSYTGKTATPRTGPSRPQILIEVEIV